METVTFKLQEEIIKKVDRLVEPLHYSNRTEFIREAIREKINKIENDAVLRELKKFQGAAKVHVSDARHEQIREEVAREYAKKFGVKLD